MARCGTSSSFWWGVGGPLLLFAGGCYQTRESDRSSRDCREWMGSPPLCGGSPGGSECVPATCDEGAWRCPEGARLGCSSSRCGGEPDPECYPVDSEGYCLDYTEPAECRQLPEGAAWGWSCPADTMDARRCTWRSPLPPPSPCNELSPAACAIEPRCVPVFDNQCCRGCGFGMDPIPCADCEQWVPIDCLPAEEACDPTAGRSCWQAAEWGCPSEPPRTPDCSLARPAGDGTCTVPGCILRREPPCVDCIPAEECVPLREQECEAVCLQVAPDCGEEGMVPEMRDGCFTGWCVHRRWCTVPRVMPSGG